MLIPHQGQDALDMGSAGLGANTLPPHGIDCRTPCTHTQGRMTGVSGLAEQTASAATPHAEEGAGNPDRAHAPCGYRDQCHEHRGNLIGHVAAMFAKRHAANDAVDVQLVGGRSETSTN